MSVRSVIAVILFLFAIVLGGLFWNTAQFTAEIEQKYPPIGRFVEVDGVKLHYVEAGAGPTVVLIHGAAGNLRDFTLGLVDDLARDFHVVAFDRPGYGHSERPDYRMHYPKDQAAMIHDAIGQLGLKKPIILGHSWGGAVATAYGIWHPDDLSGLILLAPVAYPWKDPFVWYNRLVKWPVVGWLAYRTMVVPLGQRQLTTAVDQTFRPSPPLKDYGERAGIALFFRPKTFTANARDNVHLKLALAEQSKKYGQIAVPTVIITGDSDPTVWPLNHSVPLNKAIQGSELHWLEGVGHMPHHADPDAVLKAVKRIQAKLVLRENHSRLSA